MKAIRNALLSAWYTLAIAGMLAGFAACLSALYAIGWAGMTAEDMLRRRH